MIGDFSSISKHFAGVPEKGKNESKIGIVSIDQMVQFAKNSIAKSAPQVESLASFCDQNKNLSPQQINYLIRKIKETIKETPHENHAVDSEILKAATSNLFNESVDLAEISDKECVWQFLLSRPVDVWNFRHILNFLKENIHDQYECTSVGLDILATSNLDEFDKASCFNQVFSNVNLDTVPQIDQLLARFPSLKIDSDNSSVQDLLQNMARYQPLLLSQTVQHFGIKDPNVLFSMCLRSGYVKPSELLTNIRNFTGENSDLTLELLVNQSEYILPVINTLGLEDKDKIQIFNSWFAEEIRPLEGINNSQERAERQAEIIRRFGELSIKNEEEKIGYVTELVNQYPAAACRSLSSMGIDSAASLKIVLSLINLIKDAKGEEENTIHLVDNIRFLAFDQDQLFEIADAFKNCNFDRAALKVLPQLTPENQIAFCSKHNWTTLSSTNKKLMLDPRITSDAKLYVFDHLIKEVTNVFSQQNLKPPQNLEEFCKTIIPLEEDQILTRILSENNISQLDKAILLTHFAPRQLAWELDKFAKDLTEEQKSLIIHTLIDAGYLTDILRKLDKLNITDTKLSDYLIECALTFPERSDSDSPDVRPFFLHPLFKLYTEDVRYSIALKLQKIAPDIIKHLQPLDLSPAHKSQLLIQASEKESFFRNIFSQDLGAAITSKDLREIMEHSIQRDGVKSFLQKSRSNDWRVGNVVTLLEGDDKIRIVDLIAEKDWNACIENLNRFKMEKESIINLAKKSKIDSIATMVELGHGILIASRIKDLNLDANQRAEIAQAVSKQNFYDLIPFLTDFGLKDPMLLEEFALSAVSQHPEQFSKNIDAFQLDDQKKLSFLEEIAKTNPKIAAEQFSHFQFKDPKAVHQVLLNVASTIYRQDPQAFEENFPHFGLGDPVAVRQLEFNRVLDLIKEGKFSELQTIKFTSNKIYLEQLAHYLMKTGTDIHAISWACHFLEQAARQYQNEGDYNKALDLRLQTSHLNLRLNGNPLEKFEDNLQQPNLFSSGTTTINYGIIYNGMDTELLKGERFRVRDVLVDNQEKRIVDFKVAYWNANEIRENLRNLDTQKATEWLGKSVTISQENSVYYPCQKNNYDTQSTVKFVGGPLQVLEIEGLGRIQIGNSLEWGSESNLVKVILNKGSTLQELQQVLSVLGLMSILLPSTKEDQTKLKLNTLIHFFYPSFAASNDRDSQHHLRSQEEILASLERAEGRKAVERVLGHLNDLREIELVSGEKHFYLDKFSEELDLLGARAIMSGVGFLKSFRSSAEQIASMLAVGFMAKQTRYELGIGLVNNQQGASPSEDFKENAADRTFFRLWTQSAVDQDKKISTLNNLGGNIQIFASTEIFNYIPYFHRQDYYGARNPHTWRSDKYESRPGPLVFVKENQNVWIENNEIMVRERFDFSLLRLITYQDPRKALILEIDKGIVDGIIDADFFQGCQTTEDKLALFSKIDNLETALAKLPDFDPADNTYKKLSLQDHWLINAKELIVNELKNQNCFDDKLIIVEADKISEIQKYLETCNSIKKRTIELQTKCEKLAGRFVTIQQGYNQSYNPYITAIENKIKKLNDNDFYDLVKIHLTPEVRRKIADLQEQCNQHLVSLDHSGQDSLNRELLTSDWNTALRDPSVIISLFLLDEQEKRGGDYESLLRYETRGPKWKKTGQNDEIKLSEAILYGLDQHPAILEKLPLNHTESLGSTFQIMEQYVNRSDIENTFLPVLQAIKSAYETLYGNQAAPPQGISSKFDQAYTKEKWKDEYLLLAENILNKTKNVPEKTLLFNKAGYNPFELRKQVLGGLNRLLKREGIESESLTKEELISKISQSIYLLDLDISHFFYDRLHFTAALTSTDTIDTKDGPLTIPDLFMGIMQSFEKVDETNAIAAEQFYIRLLMIDETINKQLL